MKKTKLISFILIVAIFTHCFFDLGITVFAANIDDASVFIKQTGSDWCTYAAATNMVRRRALLEGDAKWSTYTDTNLRNAARLPGVGMEDDYTYEGYNVTATSWESKSTEEKKSELISMLASHPEGIVIYTYDGTYTHAILACKYSDGIFYVADPANYLPRGLIKLTEARFNGTTQDERISWIKKIWYMEHNQEDINIPEVEPEPVPLSVSLSKTAVNLDLSSNPTDIINISLEGDLPEKYKMDFNCQSNVKIAWSGWSADRRNIKLSITATEHTANSTVGTVYLRDSMGNTYASASFNIYVSENKNNISLDAPSRVDIDYTVKPSEIITLSIDGTIPADATLGVETSESVTADMKQISGQNKVNICVTATESIKESYGVITVYLRDGDNNILDFARINVYNISPVHRIEYNLNGGYYSAEYEDDYVNQKSATQYKGYDFQIDIDNPERDGYDFLGWTKNINETKAQYTNGDSFCVNSDTVLYAVWKKKKDFSDRNTDGITVYADGQKLDFDVQPKILNNRTMVPMREIFESLGAKVTWDDKSRTAMGKTKDNTVKITIGQNFFYKNNVKKSLDCPAVIDGGRTLVPVRAIAQALGCEVVWHENIKVVEIVSSKK